MHFHWRIMEIAVVLWAFIAPSSNRAGDKEVDAILADWKARQHAFERVRYEVIGTVEYRDRPLPPGSPVRPKRVVILLDLKHRRFRREVTWDNMVLAEPAHWYTSRATMTFDGKETRAIGNGGEDDDGKTLGVIKGGQRLQRIDAELTPLFCAHGIVPSLYGELRPDKWPGDFDPDNFEWSGRQSINGVTYDVLRTVPVPNVRSTSNDEFWVARTRSSAVARWATFNGRTPFLQIDAGWQEVAGAWLPKKWTVIFGSGRGDGRIEKLEVESVEANAPASDGDFTILATSGMTVIEQTEPSADSGLHPGHPAIRKYRVSSSGSWELQSETGFRTLDGTPVPAVSLWRSWWPWCAATGLASLVCLFLIGRLVRRRRSSVG